MMIGMTARRIQSPAVHARRLSGVARQISPGVVACIDLWVGLVWLLLPPHYWESPFYGPAHRVVGWLPYSWQFRAWGILVIVLALGWYFRRPGHEQIARFCVAGLCAVWAFWTILTTLGWITGHVGGLLPPLTFLAARAHWPGGSGRRGQTRASSG